MNENIFSLDQKAKQLAKNYLSLEAQLLEVLMEMKRGNVFIALGYTGIFNYCLYELKLSEAQSYYFKKVAEKSEEVPELKAAIQNGELSLSHARRIAPVVTSENIGDWVGKAQSLTQKELEREVAQVNPKAHEKKSVPEKVKVVSSSLLELKVGIDAKTEQQLNRLKDILAQKRQGPVSLGEVIKWPAQEMVERHDPLARAKRSRKLKQTPAAPAKENIFLEETHSPQIKKSFHRIPIPAAIKHSKWQLSGGQCEAVSPLGHRCREERWLELHHRVLVSKGGSNTVDNLILLCRAHHRYAHEGHSRNTYQQRRVGSEMAKQ